jgi:hypothetical protein
MSTTGHHEVIGVGLLPGTDSYISGGFFFFSPFVKYHFISCGLIFYYFFFFFASFASFYIINGILFIIKDGDDTSI